jgi:hypothetical protein
VLQNCTGLVDGETGSWFDTFVPCGVDGTEEVNTNLEDAIDIINEMAEAISFPPINTENEVRICCVCVRLWQRMIFGHLLRTNRIVNVHLFKVFSVIFCVPHGILYMYSFLKRREFLKIIAIN